MLAAVSRLTRLAPRRWIGRGRRRHAPEPPPESAPSGKPDGAALARRMALTARQANFQGVIRPGIEVWVVDLGPVRDILASHWHRLSEPVHQVARRIIGTYVGAEVEIEPDGDRYILRFPSRAKRGWGNRVYGAARAITKHLFGGGDLAIVDAKTRGPVRTS